MQDQSRRVAIALASAACFVGTAAPWPAAAQDSTYTATSGRGCVEAPDSGEPEDQGSRRCRGPGGYALNIATGDLRDAVNVIEPGGRARDLRLGEVVTSAFSEIGGRAEWRMRAGRPTALIFRLNAQDDRARPDVPHSYLIVARLDRACVTAIVLPGPRQNERARAAADRPGPCLEPLQG